VECTVSSEGIPTGIKVIEATDSTLEKMAQETVKTWRFEPALHDGEAIAMKTQWTLNFRRPMSVMESRWNEDLSAYGSSTERTPGISDRVRASASNPR